ncbi:hypothetical protein Bca4012_055310 [Brassica carinata]|uniref:Dof zinc finger protein n=1 Tax=Brassica carinata TaxID=52824 RepID=A0A8X8B1J4_BRACI|nr:hypothetical protein Bca52824_011700 [Brassica carinata]
MDYSSVFADGDNEVNQEKPPPRVCPRCNSTNTKFCYYNNYRVSQPRYKCKDCLRHWTHGGALRNKPIGGSGRKNKCTRKDQPFVSQAVYAAIQQVSPHQTRHQPFSHAQETNQFVGTFGGSSASSSGIAFGDQIGSFPEIHDDVVLPFQSFPSMDRSYFHDRLFQQDYYNVESNDMIGNHLNNQAIGSYNVVNSDHSSYINQEYQNKWNQSFNNTMNMNASTSESREPSDTDHMNKSKGNIKNNCVYKSSYHLEKHGP